MSARALSACRPGGLEGRSRHALQLARGPVSQVSVTAERGGGVLRGWALEAADR